VLFVTGIKGRGVRKIEEEKKIFEDIKGDLVKHIKEKKREKEEGKARPPIEGPSRRQQTKRDDDQGTSIVGAMIMHSFFAGSSHGKGGVGNEKRGFLWDCYGRIVS